MTGIGHYNYDMVDLPTKHGWLAGSKGAAAVEPQRQILAIAAQAYTASDQNLSAGLGSLGLTWEGAAADAAIGALRKAATRSGDAAAAGRAGGASVGDYGMSFDSMRTRVHSEPSPMVWGTAPGLPYDLFDIQFDQHTIVQRDRTLDAEANQALYEHERRSREALATFPTLTHGEPVAAPAGAGTSGPPGSAGQGAAGGTGAAGSPRFDAPAGSGTGLPSPIGTAAPSSMASRPETSIDPAGVAPTSPGPTSGWQPPQPTVPAPGAGTRPEVSGVAPWLPPTSGSSASGPLRPAAGSLPRAGMPSGTSFAARLPAVAQQEPVIGSQRPAPAVTPTAAARSTTGVGGVPLMGAGFGGGGTERGRKYWVPTSEAFDVALPPHVDGVIGAEEK